MTMLAVTHEMSFARSVSTRTIFVDKGVVAEEGPSADVLARPRNARTREFLSRILDPAHTLASGTQA
jgi:polar amino acid transport system ATP-binding protein